jgi:hypothetical protein
MMDQHAPIHEDRTNYILLYYVVDRHYGTVLTGMMVPAGMTIQFIYLFAVVRLVRLRKEGDSRRITLHHITSHHATPRHYHSHRSRHSRH